MIERHGSVFAEPEGVPNEKYWDSARKAIIQARKNLHKRDEQTWDEVERLIKLEDYTIFCSKDAGKTLHITSEGQDNHGRA